MSVVCRRIAVPVLGIFLLGVGAGCDGRKTKYPEQVAENGVVSVDLSIIGRSYGQFYTYRAATGKKVDFFVYRESSGEPHAVLDACKTCFRWKQGYRLQGAEVVCLKCDMRFKLDDLAHGTGSCVPILVQTVQRGDTMVLPVSELEAGSRFF